MKIFNIYLVIIFSILINSSTCKAAENIIIYKGNLSRRISLDSLNLLAKKKEATGTLKNLLRFTNQNKNDVSEFLNQEYELPLVLTSKLINSEIGTVIITRITKIIYPDKNQNSFIGIPAIRAAVINGIIKGEGKLNLIGFLEAYPNKNIAINYSALNNIINKVESMTDLVEFFTGSPLNKLKNTNPN